MQIIRNAARKVKGIGVMKVYNPASNCKTSSYTKEEY